VRHLDNLSTKTFLSQSLTQCTFPIVLTMRSLSHKRRWPKEKQN